VSDNLQDTSCEHLIPSKIKVIYFYSRSSVTVNQHRHSHSSLQLFLNRSLQFFVPGFHSLVVCTWIDCFVSGHLYTPNFGPPPMKPECLIQSPTLSSVTRAPGGSTVAPTTAYPYSTFFFTLCTQIAFSWKKCK